MARRSRLTLTVVALAALATTATPAASAAAAPARLDLPPGVIKLNDSERCPMATLCLYQHYNRRGPAYGIGAGYQVDLRELPMNGGTAANNVSSWVNNTDTLAVLIDEDTGTARPLFPRQQLEEPPPYNDTVDQVDWA
ncbi:peptidase inhibitor family I36 protein [Actinomadura sp. 1N219]|uniref:peptidase inhibitor family I36 protein n=1 Tax=Actinomadura sp. 1N219 TaxID=3375152 RepID=UPI0037B06FC9